jgi:hypothetical protein
MMTPILYPWLAYTATSPSTIDALYVTYYFDYQFTGVR